MNLPVDPLDELLARCAPTPEPPAQLAAKIRRLLAERGEAQMPTWASRLDAIFGRPSFAVVFIAACVLLGLFLAETRISRLHAAYGAQVARSYVQLIDPLLEPAPPSVPGPTRSP